MGAVNLIRRLLRDTRGTASIEFALVAVGLTAASVAAGMLIAPALHAYADRLTAITQHADAVLVNLTAAAQANNTTGP